MTHGTRGVIGDGLERLSRIAADRGVQLLFPPEERAKHALDGLPCTWSPGVAADADLILALGGDGTTLRALHAALPDGPPVFAINYGHLGFLTSAPARQLRTAVRRAFSGELRIVALPTLRASLGGQRLGLAVNDAVVTGEAHGRTATLSWAVGGVRLGEVRCDAIVVATPAGSTAYSLSAGGPVLGWGLDALVATFVAPHSLAARSFVVSSDQRVDVTNERADAPARVVIDGQMATRPLRGGETLTVTSATERARLALLPEVVPLGRFREVFAS
jgi:NAD+ kinase